MCLTSWSRIRNKNARARNMDRARVKGRVRVKAGVYFFGTFCLGYNLYNRRNGAFRRIRSILRLLNG